MQNCARRFVLLLILLLCGAAEAQMFSGTVVDAQDAPVANAIVVNTYGAMLAASGRDGRFSFHLNVQGPIRIEVRALGYDTANTTLAEGMAARIVLTRQVEQVVVTAYRSPLETLDSPASARVLNQQQLREAAAPALDGKLRQVPGLELFRRSSSLVANPTSQGISLRGLGSTAASRTLVVSDDVPLNDPYGGWIHWEELPELAVRSVEIVRGGASDLYGSSAIGGVISVIPVRAPASRFEITSSGGSEGTLDDGALGTLKHGPWSAVGSAGLIATDGYTLIA